MFIRVNTVLRGINGFKRRVFWRKNLISLGTFPFALCNLTFTDKLLVKGQNNIIYYIDTSVLRENIPQAAQTHVAMEGCNVIYITYVTRAGVALQATVENIRDFVWEICH